MTRQHGKHPCAQYIGFAGRVGAAVTQRATLLPTRPQSGQRQKFDKVGQLSHRRGRAFALPANLDSACYRLHPSASLERFLVLCLLQFRFTHWVTPLKVTNAIACLTYTGFV